MNLNFLLSVAVALLFVYVGYQFFNGGPDVQSSKEPGYAEPIKGESSRDINEVMKQNKKNVIVFYGSQTGTAEDYASKLSKELSAKFGFKAMTADTEQFDFDQLDQFNQNSIAIFLMASYGEGEPTDNAVDMMSFFQSPEFSERETLENLNFAVFGLGNSSYEFYNKVADDLFKILVKLEANPIVPLGKGDDGKGTLEDDFMAWKDTFFTAIVKKYGVEEREAVYEPSLEVIEDTDLSAQSNDVYLGEMNLKHLVASKETSTKNEFVQPRGPYTPSNPMLASVLSSKELFKSDRNCLHIELDVTGLKYNTGDHLAFWCQNANAEVQRFAKALGLKDLQKVIKISLLDTTTDMRIPSPTTYDTVIRNYLEINGPVSRQVLTAFAPFAPNEKVKEAARKLAADKERFHTEVVQNGFNLAKLMLHLSNGEHWPAPFSLVIETVPHLQPRYYSISSSSLEDPNLVSITAVVEKQKMGTNEVKGVATNNLLSVHNKLNTKDDGEYQLYSRETGKDKLRVNVHVRHSLFKLPVKTSVPIIMVGPGTGAAPFRGFVRERAVQASRGREIGTSLLFFGSRNRNEDYIYADEWQKHDWLQVHTAFSREGPNKVYVQHRLKEQAKLVNQLLLDGASFYVCGDASNMARDVHATLVEIISKERNISTEEAETVVRKMRSRNKYQEDVW